MDDDDAMEAIWKKEYSLSAVAPDQFKSYDDLKKRLDNVLGTTSTRQAAQETQYDNYPATEQKLSLIHI
mgnify:CR=1 FL=1